MFNKKGILINLALFCVFYVLSQEKYSLLYTVTLFVSVIYYSIQFALILVLQMPNFFNGLFKSKFDSLYLSLCEINEKIGILYPSNRNM